LEGNFFQFITDRLQRIIIILTFLIAGRILVAQTKTNLEQITGLIEKSVAKIDSVYHLPEEFSLEVIVSPQMEILKNKVWENFSSNGRKLYSDVKQKRMKISYSLLNAAVAYNEIHKDGLFGNMLCDREVLLTGAIVITNPDGIIKTLTLNELNKDIVNTAEVKSLETASLPFTQSQIPEPSFFSNLVEPALVIGTLIGTVILLFTVRGK
jgi:hypothetical protein